MRIKEKYEYKYNANLTTVGMIRKFLVVARETCLSGGYRGGKRPVPVFRSDII